ncbi:MAG TPA: adenosine deaminase [Acidobacteriaceae bacterium]|nr:adenosine deaminase [Acidobacteriaceae bacterium]
MQTKRFTLILAAAWFAISIAAPAQKAAPAESRAEHAFAAAKKAGAPELYAFLKPFPKGADLHMHLSGAIYAETFLTEGAKQGICVDKTALSFEQPAKPGKCAAGQLLAADAVKDQGLYDKLIDSFSMRDFVPYAEYSAHDQFFDTFDRFGGLKDQYGEWLDEVATRAAAQNEQYLEVMSTPPFSNAAAAGYKLGWPADFDDANHMAELAKLRAQLLANGLRDDIAIDRKQLDDAKVVRERIEHCPDGEFNRPRPSDSEAPTLTQHTACSVKINYLYQLLRGFPPQQVFAQALLGFEVADADPDVVGINLVRAEDRRDAMDEYHTEMLMFDYLHSVYPRVHISLHAGELAPGMVPPEGLSFHIREAIDLGHAERIGHGVDVLHETDPHALLKQMAAQHIMVEANLTSNDVILGIKGTDHPLHAYMAAHVPWALSTDDEGVSRIDLTHEYVKGVLEQDLTYADLKQSARTSLEHAFLAGPSLWAAPDNFTHRVAACAAPIAAFPPGPCRDFLKTSERATQQYELERRSAAFEAAIK